jgi:hypothetical protein
MSEVTIDFTRSGDIVDVLEFFIANNGRMTATVAETRKWLNSSLTDVVERAVRPRA